MTNYIDPSVEFLTGKPWEAESENATRFQKRILQEGFFFSEKFPADPIFYPNGYYLIFRTYDWKPIGRCEKTDEGWQGRYWFFGGGQSFGFCRTREDVANIVLRKNAEFGPDWE